MGKGKEGNRRDQQEHLPSVELIQQELGKAESIDDFFGKEGIFARLFAETLETMLEAEISEQLGYERYEAKGRNSGNSRNGKREKSLRTSGGETGPCGHAARTRRHARARLLRDQHADLRGAE